MMLRKSDVVYFCLMACLLLQTIQSFAYERIANYSMDEVTPWNGTNGELKDSAGYTGGPYHGKAVGTPLPTSEYVQPARVTFPLSTCAYSRHAGTTNNGGAFLVSRLPVTTVKGDQHSVSFWMYWDGIDAGVINWINNVGVVPIGWNNYKLVIKNNRLGFDANDGRIYGVDVHNGILARGWHHISAVFTNLNVAANSLYIDGNLQSLSFSGSQNLKAIASFDPGSPYPGWATDNPSGAIKINSPSNYGVTGATTSHLVEIENIRGDYNLYTMVTPDKGEELTLGVDYAARAGNTTGTNSAIDVYVNNVFISRMNTQSTQMRHFDIPLGIATGSAMRVEFRSVDRNGGGGLMTTIRVLRNQAVVTPNSFSIGGFGSSSTMRFIGRLDEVIVYKGAINQQQVTQDFNGVHACSHLNYLQIAHPGEGVSCMPAQVQVKNCAGTDANGQCVAGPSSGAMSGYLNVLDRGSIVSSQPFTIAHNSAGTSVSIPITVSQNITFTLSDSSNTSANAPVFTCFNQMNSSNSCTYVAKPAGFIVTDQPNGSQVSIAPQRAGLESAYYLRAVKTNTQTGACQAALSGANSVEFGYTCTNPTTCSAGNMMRISGSADEFIAGNHQANTAAQYTAVPVVFDSDGNAPFKLNFFDVGQTTLSMRKTVNTVQLSNSSAFTTKPHHLGLAHITDSAGVANPAASNASGSKFAVAGRPFKLNVAAYTANNQPTPNFGRETTPENVVIQASLVAPVGGNPGQLTNNTTVNGAFTNGVAAMNSISWNEVGIIQLTPAVVDGDYLGAGSVTGMPSANVGRFYPDHFTVGILTTTPACSGMFSYYGQDGLLTTFQINARDANGNTTRNYTGQYGASSFAKFNIASYPKYQFSLTPAGFSLHPKINGPTGDWINGEVIVKASHHVERPNVEARVMYLRVVAKPTDDDGVTIESATPISKPSQLRYGRLFLPPAHGSEFSALPLRIESQFWSGVTYVRNLMDSCTAIPLDAIVMKNFHGNLNACETSLTGNATLINGVAGIQLTAPGIGSDGRPNRGSVDLEINLNGAGGQTCSSGLQKPAISAAMPWFGSNPSTKATFGAYKSPIIYFRENF